MKGENYAKQTPAQAIAAMMAELDAELAIFDDYTAALTAIIQGKVYFHTDNIPANYIHIFEEVGTYFVTIMICPYNAAAVPFTFKLVTGTEPSVEPIIED